MSDRSYVCVCGGRVSVPKGRRNITIDQVREHHYKTCPARERKT